MTLADTDSRFIKHVKFEDRVVGRMIMDVDGFWYYDDGKYWSEETIGAIYKLLRGLNEPYNQELEKYFESCTKK